MRLLLGLSLIKKKGFESAAGAARSLSPRGSRFWGTPVSVSSVWHQPRSFECPALQQSFLLMRCVQDLAPWTFNPMPAQRILTRVSPENRQSSEQAWRAQGYGFRGSWLFLVYIQMVGNRELGISLQPVLNVIRKPSSINKLSCPADCCSHLLTSDLHVTPQGHKDQPAPGSMARCPWKWPVLWVTHLLWNVNRFSQGSA